MIPLAGLKAEINWKTIAAVVGGVIVLYLFTKSEIKGAVKAVVGGVGSAANAVNPLNNENIIYGGVNKVGEVLTGDPSWSLGSWLYDQFNPPYDPNADASAPKTRKQQVGALSNYYADLVEKN